LFGFMDYNGICLIGWILAGKLLNLSKRDVDSVFVIYGSTILLITNYFLLTIIAVATPPTIAPVRPEA
jgi:hypothetical protein